MLNREQFVAKYAEFYEIQKKQAKQNIEEVVNMIQKAVIEDGGVDFYGFMKIEKTRKEAHTVRNPKDGSMIEVPDKYVPKVKFSSRFKKSVSGIDE